MRGQISVRNNHPIHLTFQVKSSAGAVGRTVKASKPINFGDENDSSDEEEVKDANNASEILAKKYVCVFFFLGRVRLDV